MSHVMLSKVFEGAGLKREGATYLLPEELEATLYVTLGDEVLQVARAVRAEVTSDLVTLVTVKGERFFVPPDRVVAVKLGTEAKAAKSAAGFR